VRGAKTEAAAPAHRGNGGHFAAGENRVRRRRSELGPHLRSRRNAPAFLSIRRRVDITMAGIPVLRRGQPLDFNEARRQQTAY